MEQMWLYVQDKVMEEQQVILPHQQPQEIISINSPQIIPTIKVDLVKQV
jgi:hypothetical protein